MSEQSEDEEYRKMVEPYRRIDRLELPPSLASRTRFLAEADRNLTGSIDKGVLLLMAFWSGPSWLALKELKRFLVTADPSGQLELVVVDIDFCPDLLALPQFVGKLNGAGEAAWIRDGKIICVSLGGYH